MPCSSTILILNLAKHLSVKDLQTYFESVNSGKDITIVVCGLPVRCAHITFLDKTVAARVLEKRHWIRNVPLNILPVEEMDSFEIFREVQAAISPNLIGKMLQKEESLDAILKTLEEQTGAQCTHTPDTHECLITGDWGQIQGAYSLIAQYLTEEKLSTVECEAVEGVECGVSFSKQTMEGTSKWNRHSSGDNTPRIQRQLSCPTVGSNSTITHIESETLTEEGDGSTLTVAKKTLKYNSSFETVSEKDEIDAFQAMALIDYSDTNHENANLKRRPSTLAEMFQSHRPKLEDCSVSKNHVSVGESEITHQRHMKKKTVALKREDAGQQYRPVFDLSTDD